MNPTSDWRFGALMAIQAKTKQPGMAIHSRIEKAMRYCASLKPISVPRNAGIQFRMPKRRKYRIALMRPTINTTGDSSTKCTNVLK